MESLPKSPVLSVDLDGTLISSDLLLESFLSLIKQNFFYVITAFFWLIKGKANLKSQIARRVKIDPTLLPYNQPFLNWLVDQKRQGRHIWLCTASNHKFAQAVADHLKIFSGVLASDTINLSGANKAKALVDMFGLQSFDYCGNSSEDLKVWRVSNGAVVVNGSRNLVKKASASTQIIKVFAGDDMAMAFLKALRLHQWVKNFLVFVPLLAAHKLSNHQSLLVVGLAFLAFGLCASSVYLLNDMLDINADRLHPRKKHRPFASGAIPLHAGFVLAPLLLIVSFALALLLPPNYVVVQAIYYVITFAYTFVLKRFVLIDTIALAGLYTLRIVAGAAAIDVPLSFWLLLFSIFLFYSLALVKRFAELKTLEKAGGLNAKGRGYHVEDLPMLSQIGVSCGGLCVLVLGLYINSPAVNPLYRTPEFLWVLCVILLFWIGRVWLKANRNEMNEDPIIFALHDKISFVCGFIAAIAIVLAV